VIGVAQTIGQAFIAWVPGKLTLCLLGFEDSLELRRLINGVTVVILNVGKYAPRFKMGFIVMSVLSVGEFSMIFVIRWFANREKRKRV